MTLRGIFNSIIDFDVTKIFVGAWELLLWTMPFVMPIVMVWMGGMILKNVLIDKQPADRDLFAKIFMIVAGLCFIFVLPPFLIYEFFFK